MKNTLTCSLLASALIAAPTLASTQMPAPLLDIKAAASTDWTKAQTALRSAIECRSALNHTAAVQAVFHATNHVFDGNYAFPAPLMVFGTLKASNVWVFEGGNDVGSSYTVQLEGMKLEDVVKAAGLRKDPLSQLFFRQIKDGHLEASELQPGVVQLACIHNGSNV